MFIDDKSVTIMAHVWISFCIR